MKTPLADKIELLIGRELPDNATPGEIKLALIQAGYGKLTRGGIPALVFENMVDMELERKGNK